VRLIQKAFAPVIEHLARAIEDHVWMLGAGIHVDLVLRVARHARHLAPLPAIGEPAPARNKLVLTFAGVDRDHWLFPPSSV
jgi:hypothetical protein